MTLLPEFRDQLHAAASQRARDRRGRIVGRLPVSNRFRTISPTLPVVLSVVIAVTVCRRGAGHAAPPTPAQSYDCSVV